MHRTTDREDWIRDRLRAVHARIETAARACGRDPSQVRLLAVSKKVTTADLRVAQAAGQESFGESYLNEALPKITAIVNPAPEWHFIGPLQSNKTRRIAENFAWVHSVDRLNSAQRLNEQRPGYLPPLNVCLQVNISGESSKSGLRPDQLSQVAAAVATLPNLHLRGLMAIPAPSADIEVQHAAFRRVRAAFELLNSQGLGLDTLSMGMSGDLEAAIAEGATIVRVGTAIFGARA
jgi:PLP dependent protein